MAQKKATTAAEGSIENEQGSKNPVKVGQIVKYFPNGKDNEAALNNTEVVPAIVVQVFSPEMANLRVFQDGQSIPLSRQSVKVGVSEETAYCLID